MNDRLASTSDFLLELYSDAADCHPEAFRLRTLERLTKLIDFDFAVWGGGAAESRDVTDLVTYEQSPEILHDWSQVADQDAFCDITLGQLGKAARFDDIRNYRDSIAYNDHWRRFGARQMMATISAEPLDGYVSFVGLCSEARTNVFCDASRMMKNVIVPHLSAALRINRQSSLMRHGRESEAIGLVDRGGWILVGLDRFSELAREEGALSNRLPHGMWEGLVQTGAWQGTALLASAERRGAHYLVRLTPLGAFARLTPREMEIVRSYVTGLTFREIATELAIAPSTVRNHIANIFEKLHVASRTELVQLHLATFGQFTAPDTPKAPGARP